jgi:chorismate mutase
MITTTYQIELDNDEIGNQFIELMKKIAENTDFDTTDLFSILSSVGQNYRVIVSLEATAIPNKF